MSTKTILSGTYSICQIMLSVAFMPDSYSLGQDTSYVTADAHIESNLSKIVTQCNSQGYTVTKLEISAHYSLGYTPVPHKGVVMMMYNSKCVGNIREYSTPTVYEPLADQSKIHGDDQKQKPLSVSTQIPLYHWVQAGGSLGESPLVQIKLVRFDNPSVSHASPDGNLYTYRIKSMYLYEKTLE